MSLLDLIKQLVMRGRRESRPDTQRESPPATLTLQTLVENLSRVLHETSATQARLASELEATTKTMSNGAQQKEIAQPNDALTANHGADLPADAGALFLMHREIVQNKKTWAHCDIILTCPLTHDAVARILGPTSLLRIEHNGHLVEVLKNTRTKSLGIASPWVAHQIKSNPAELLAVWRATQRTLLLLCTPLPMPASLLLRKQLHRVGYYEIALCLENDRVDFSSVGCLPDGQFDFLGSEPGFPDNSVTWHTLMACRAALPVVCPQDWTSIFPNPLCKLPTGYGVALPGAFSLSVSQPLKPPDAGTGVQLSAILHWQDSAQGHASLVTGYQGPGDTYMQCVLLELAPGSEPLLAVWFNLGTWQRLAAAPVPQALLSRNGSIHSLPLSVTVHGDLLTVVSQGQALHRVDCPNAQTTGAVGLRILNEGITISDIRYQRWNMP